jgi:hypothetical protein
MLSLNLRRIPTWLSVGAALAFLSTAANANTFTINASGIFPEGPGTISGSFTMTPGDWSTIANVNVQAALPYNVTNFFGGIIGTATDNLTFNSASFVPNSPGSSAGYISLTNTNQPAASYHIALGITPQNASQNINTDYNVGTYGSGHPSEAQDLTRLWDYFQGTLTDPADIPAAPVATTPEPSTWAMMLLGLLGLGAWFHRSRRSVATA